MTDHSCLGCGKVHPDAREVTLHDGTVVSSYSEAFRHEGEAISVLSLPTAEDRRYHLRQIEKIRGKPAADALRSLVLTLWEKRRAELERERNKLDTVFV